MTTRASINHESINSIATSDLYTASKSIRYAAAPKNSTQNTLFGILWRNKRAYQNVSARSCQVKKTTRLRYLKKWRCTSRVLHKKRIYTDQEMQLQAEPFKQIWCNVLRIYDLILNFLIVEKLKMSGLIHYLRYSSKKLDLYRKLCI